MTDSTDILLIILAGFVIGSFFSLALLHSANAILPQETADNVCEQIYGDGWEFKDTKWGLDTSFTCTNVQTETKTIQKEIEERRIWKRSEEPKFHRIQEIEILPQSAERKFCLYGSNDKENWEEIFCTQ